ncbi:hypothetical protein B7463_g828, partial [Scytalidium lignicola]
MSSLTEFTIFSALPTELRLKIWESVPQPVRVIGQLPCSKCWKFLEARVNRSGEVRTDCAANIQHPDWHLRWVGNNQDEAIFPPLHACRESRAAWMPHYFSPPRYLDLPHNNIRHREGEGPESYRLRFDIPFVSYETDVFAIFDTRISFLGFDADPFLGFDRKRIRNIAISENAWSLVEIMAAVKPQSLPRLRVVSVLVLGPNPNIDGSATSGWQEMPAVDIQHVDCDVSDVSDKLIVDHPLFNKSRLRHLIYEPEPKLRQLVNYLKLFKAWLWHGNHWDNHEARVPTDFEWWDFYDYLFGEHVDVCPLEHLPGWCPGHHTKDEMLNWGSICTVNVKFLVEKRCMVELTSSTALEIDPASNYERFAQFKEKRIADFKMRKALE